MVRNLIILFVTIFGVINSIKATHLVGGSLRYEFIQSVDTDNNGFTDAADYRIIMNYYYNCDGTANPIFQNPTMAGFQSGSQSTITAAIYAHDDPSNIYPQSATSYPKYGSEITLNFDTLDVIELNNPSGCLTGNNICVYLVRYQTVVRLSIINPSNNQPVIGGYHIVHERCCRNAGINNIQNPGGVGMSYYAYVPPVGYENTSPDFIKEPLPFICANDSTSALNTAIDADGDQLVFSYVSPLDGNITSGGNPAPNTYPNNYTLPIATVPYSAGHSFQNPFGTGGSYTVNAQNGLTNYYAASVGKYVVAAMIQEYRVINGVSQLYGITTREIQLNVTNCPPNSPPNLNPQAGTTNTSIVIEEGDSVCVDFGYFDQSTPADSMILTVNGQIFDPAVTNPPATITDSIVSDPNGADTINATFCWGTACGQAQALPYIFTVTVEDRGCPPKTINTVFDVTINEYVYNGLPIGNNSGICQNSLETYSVINDPNIPSYDWNVSGGIIVQNWTDSIQVLWTNAGAGTVNVSAVNQFGCPSDPNPLNVIISPAPLVEAGTDSIICSGDSTILLGTTTANPGYTSIWTSDTTNLLNPDPSLSSPNTLLTNAYPTDTTTYFLIVDIGGGCYGIDSVKVFVESGQVEAGLDQTICLGDSVQLSATGNGISYSWSPIDSLSNPNNQNTDAFPSLTTRYFVQSTTSNGCSGIDSMTVFVSPLPGASNNFILNGSAANLGNNEYLLTNATNWDAGAVWNQTLVNLNQPFHFDVELYFGTQNATGADGIAFGLQQLSNQVLTQGGGIGYENISPSFFVEFDTWQNGLYNDPASDHIAVQKDGVLDHSSSNNLSPAQPIGVGGNVEDGLWHNCVFDWDPSTQIFTVEFDGTQLINLNYDIINNVFGGLTATYWGFTASTGGSNNEQKIRYNPNTFFNQITDQTICDNDSVSISAPVVADSYLWEPNSFIDNNTSQNPVFNPNVTTQYVFTGTNSFGCFIKDTFQILVNDIPNLSAGADQFVCSGDSALLNATGNANTYTWDNGYIDSTTIQINDTTTYILTATTLAGCTDTDTVTVYALPLPNTFTGETDGYINLCINETVQLNGSGADTYLWTPNTFLSDPTIPNPTASPTASQQYILTGSLANGCTTTDTLLIDVNPLPTLTNGGDQTICQGDTVQIEAFGGVTFNWISPDSINDPSISNPLVWPDTTTICQALVSDVNTCEDTTELTVFVNPKPSIDAGPDQFICIGDSTSLSASGNAITYTWNNGIIDGVNFQVNVDQQYILTGTDANNCVNSDTVSVNVIQLPNIDAGNDVSICLDDSVQLNASGGATYSWSPTTNISNTIVVDPFVFPILDTKYYVIGTDTNGCANIDSVQITIDALPTITTSNDTSLCSGDSISISAGGGVSYLWLTTDSIDQTTINNPSIWPTNSTIYQVLVTGSNNCSDTGSISITVNSLPNIDAGVNVDVCFGDTAQLNASGGVNYEWLTTTTISNTTTSNPNVWPTDTLIYQLKGTDANQCINYDSVTVNVLALPIADAGPDLWICPGGSIQLSATGGLGYVWFPDSTLNDGSIQTPDANPADNETYVVTVTDINNCSNNDTLFLEVHPNVPTDAGGDTLTICEGTSVILGGSPTSPLGSTYQWSPSSTLTSSTTANPSATPIAPTLFTVNTANDTCSGVDSVFVTFFPTLVASTGNDVQICLGDSTTLSVTGGDFYQWSPITNSFGDTIIINDTLANATVFPSDTTLFYVLISDTNGCNMTDSTLVTVNPLPNFNLGNNTSICLYDSITLQASSGDTYAWTPNYNITDTSIANPQVYNQVDTTYFVTVTDSNACINTDSITISVNSLPTVTVQGNDTICYGTSTQLIAIGALSYVWSPVDSLSNPAIPYPNANPDTNISYTVTGTDANGCTDQDSIAITVLPLPNVDAGNDTTICPGLSVQLNATGGSTYQWLTPVNLSNFLIANPIATPDTLTTYVVSTTDTNGCINTDTMVVALYDSADADAGFNVSACYNQGVQLNASGGVSYSWEPSFYVNHPTLPDPLAFPNDDMTFTVQVTDSNGCIDFDDVNITVFIANAGTDTIICNGDSIQKTIGGDPATTFSWSPTDGVSDPTSYNPFLSPTTPTTYIVNIGNAAGCNYIDTVFVNVSNPLPTFDTILDPGCDGVVAEYTNTSNSEFDFVWNFSDGDSSTQAEVEKIFDFGSSFSATLTVQDSLSCTNSVTINGNADTFENYFDIYYPNVFTPNGDGENDQFIIEVPGRIYECTELIIYNRWGQVQFISTGNNLRWDGRNSVGGELPNGAYFFTLNVKNGFFSQSGTLYLFK